MKNITLYLGLALKLLVFLLVLGFALKNSHTVIFYAYLGQVWQAPLIVMLGLVFVLGALTGEMTPGDDGDPEPWSAVDGEPELAHHSFGGVAPDWLVADPTRECENVHASSSNEQQLS